MKANLSGISEEELKTDLEDSLVDIKNCAYAISYGIIEISGIDIRTRMKNNYGFVEKITEELFNRNFSK